MKKELKRTMKTYYGDVDFDAYIQQQIDNLRVVQMTEDKVVIVKFLDSVIRKLTDASYSVGRHGFIK